MNVPDLHQRALDEFEKRVLEIKEDGWRRPTPNPEWDVRALVSHIVDENRWTPPLLAGSTIEDVGDRFEGDLLGDDPTGAWNDSSRQAVRAVHEDGAMGRTVHLSFGDVPGEEYAMQLFADHLIHAWDLARAIGADEQLDPELVEACSEWFEQREDLYRAAGAVGDRPEIGPNADPQTALLAMFGRKV
ncbi:MAG: TIGR03086 family metal-binding protein [Actinomycetota bacterium]|nr:TIGR03086 family metal-binding protein [Actinomycetota bacterium]